MIEISKALPVKFWLDGLGTFNEKVEPGIDRQFFLQKWNSADTVRLQFINTEEKSYVLVVKDASTDVELGRVSLTKTAIEDSFQYDVSFAFVDLGIVTRKVKLYLVSTENTIAITVNGKLGTISATLDNGVVQFDIDANVTGKLGTVSATAVFYQFNSATFKLGELSGACTAPDITLYYTGVYGTGTRVYTEPEMINWPVGYNHIIKEMGNIFEYDDITGTVGADTLTVC